VSTPNLSALFWSVANILQPPRPLSDAELKGVTDRIVAMIGGLSA
jgi:hypothetical protein